jgi:hypothetical protein
LPHWKELNILPAQQDDVAVSKGCGCWELAVAECYAEAASTYVVEVVENVVQYEYEDED